MLLLRLNKLLPGLSRRHADAAILAGRVRVDGEVVVTPGMQVTGVVTLVVMPIISSGNVL